MICSTVYPGDRRAMAEVDALLEREGLRRDRNLDYTCALYGDDGQIAATGSCFGPTLRCLAVSSGRRGEGLLAQVVTHLIQVQYERGNCHLFLCAKEPSAKFFTGLGFYEIARVEGAMVFMENRRDGFGRWLRELEKYRSSGTSAALVMNANPFTLGHQYLAETAAARCGTLHIFLVSEEASLVPFSVRRRLAEAGTAHLANAVLHDSGPYIISRATFPSYFLPDEAAVIEGHARLDLAVFVRIARALGVTERFVGEEPASLVTGLYNRVMAGALPRAGIGCTVVPRREAGGAPISASTVRQYIRQGKAEAIRELVPPAVYEYFTGPEAEPVIERIRQAENVVHY